MILSYICDTCERFATTDEEPVIVTKNGRVLCLNCFIEERMEL